MKRDLLAWVVDITTVVVGVAAVIALYLSARALKQERKQLWSGILQECLN